MFRGRLFDSGPFTMHEVAFLNLDYIKDLRNFTVKHTFTFDAVITVKHKHGKGSVKVYETSR